MNYFLQYQNSSHPIASQISHQFYQLSKKILNLIKFSRNKFLQDEKRADDKFEEMKIGRKN